MNAAASGPENTSRFTSKSTTAVRPELKRGVRFIALTLAASLLALGSFVPAQADDSATPAAPDSSSPTSGVTEPAPTDSAASPQTEPIPPADTESTPAPEESSSASPDSAKKPVGGGESSDPDVAQGEGLATPNLLAAVGDPIITVHAGGIRTGASSVGPLPNGATFSATAVTGSPAGGPFTCTVSDGSGTCEINVPSGYRWDVKQTAAPAGYYLNPTLDFGGSSTVAPETYAFRTGIVDADIDVPGTNPNGTYADARHPGANYFSGLLASSLINPSVAERCGLDVALVLDQSGSMAGTKQTDLKAAANDAINALTGTPSNLAIYTFAGAVGPHLGATSTSTTASAQPLHNFINGLGAPNGYTNWDAGIYQVPSGFDIAIVLTDGAPTTSGSSPGAGAESYFKYAEQGIFSANALKSHSTRVVGLGIGISGAEANLRAISGQSVNSDYYLASNENFDDVLRELATGSCNSQLTIQKQVQDPTGALLPNSALANDWAFANTTSVGTIDQNVTTGIVNAQNGFAAAAVSLPAGSTPTLSVTETVKPGYTLVRAECSVNGQAVATQLTGSTATFAGSADQPMSCIFVNQQDPGAWTLSKTASPTPGTDVLAGQDVTYTLTATNDTDVAVVNATATDDLTDVVDNATLGTLPAGLSQSGNTLTWAIGTIAPHAAVSISFTVTVNAGQTSEQLVNTAKPGEHGSCVSAEQCETTHQIVLPDPVITLFKRLDTTYGGTASATDWTLGASGPVSISGVTGDSAITTVTVPAGDYTLAESGGPAGQYQWSDLTCTQEGHEVSGVSVDTPVVTLSRGDDVQCAFTNQDLPAKLTLEKIVDNNDANSTNVPSDFTLTATPVNITGQDTISGNGEPTSDKGVNGVKISAGSYQLSETGPDGFDAAQWQCAGGVLVGDIVTVMNGEDVECRITNTALDPILTLVKVVDNGETGGLATTDDWTLIADGTASGATKISGTSGDASVTTAFVPVGTYSLSEKGTLDGYTASDWVCDNGYSGTELELGLAETVTCTVTNTATPASWGVEKTSNPGSGKTVQPGDEITYHVTLTHLDGVVPAGVTITDDLSDVLDNATWGDVVVDSGDAQLSGNTLTWTTGQVGDTATMSYTVVVNPDAYNVILRNVVTPPPGGQCFDSCTTEHPTPHFLIEKSSDPASGSLVNAGDSITYTLTARNDSEATVSGATATDDLTTVLAHAELVTPLATGLTLGADGHTLTWEIPDIAAGSDPVTVQYVVKLADDAAGATLTNEVVAGEGGDCVSDVPTLLQQTRESLCITEIQVRSVDLSIAKSHTIPEAGDSVESGNGSSITYQLVAQNLGTQSPRDDATAVTITDKLPEGLSYDIANFVAPDWDTTGTTATELRATYVANGGVLAAGASSTLEIPAIVGVLPKPGNGKPFSSLINRACVAAEQVDANQENNCSSDEVKVKWVGLDPVPRCVSGVPAVDYVIPVFNGNTTPVVTMVWWTPEAFQNRNPSIPASDTAALIADGAQAVDNIPVPITWTNGDSITGMQLWPGSAINAQGLGTAWPGWSQRGDGTWFLNPQAPFYAIHETALIEVRVTSAVASESIIVSVPTGCTPGNRLGGLSLTGTNSVPWMLATIPLVALGASLVRWSRRRRNQG